MVKIQDLRSIAPRTNGTRPVSSIKNIARHYSATKTGDWHSFWRYWNGTLKWGTGGYHEIILRDGTVQLCYDPHEITNGVGGQNSYIYNICLVSDGTFTDAQERAWEERVLYWMNRLKLPVSAVKGHREFPGQSTACPGINMNTVRSRLSQLLASGGAATPSTPSYFKLGDVHEALKTHQKRLNTVGNSLAVDGSFGNATLQAVRKFQSDYGLVVDGYLGQATQKKLAEVANSISKGELTVSQYNELKKEIEALKKKVGTDRGVTDSFKDDWQWAKNKKFFDGSNPSHVVTREQLSAILHRYSKDNNLTRTSKNDLIKMLQEAYESGIFSTNHTSSVEGLSEHEIIDFLISVVARMLEEHNQNK